jgi:hypothetical protein
LAVTLSNATIPPGGIAQLQFFLTANKTITSGTATIPLDPAIFDSITAADVYSATGTRNRGAAGICNLACDCRRYLLGPPVDRSKRKKRDCKK